jgi:M6 family metalloprotease-like protein
MIYRRIFILFFLLAVPGVHAGLTGKKPARLNPMSPTAVSGKNLPDGAAFKWMNGRLVRSGSLSQAEADTVRILAIMAEFKPDEDTKTTGHGTFIMTGDGSAVIDPPPHDMPYFQDQLSALSNYYRTVSGGRLVIAPAIFPHVIPLKREMGYYNPGTTEESLDRGLAELFRDAVLAADSAGASFSGYDAFIVFHAGVGKDVDVGMDMTPKDIPSVFLNLADLKEQLGGGLHDYRGIPVDGGQILVDEGILLPETESQDGYEIGLLGTAALMFGFQLGMPAMWNTQNGNTGIGRWGLMDQGSGNFNGLIPAEPDAFCKTMMGWEKPVEVRQGEGLRVACSSAEQTQKIYKIPINEREYFLIENRSHDPDGNNAAFGWDGAGNRVRFTENGQIEADKPFGVIVKVDEYDFALPGSGILIWHVDEDVILEKYPDNKINSDKNRRGVDLEEADGAQDIGEMYGMLDGGSGSETGVMHDAWYADNEIHMLANASSDVLFSPQTHPNSFSHSGANSHVAVYGFSKIDIIMTFSLNTDLLHAGFPQYFDGELTPYPPMQGDIDGDGKPELIAATQEGSVFAWNPDGSKTVLNNHTTSRTSISGDTLRFPAALFCNRDRTIDVPPVIGNEHGIGVADQIHIAGADGIRTYTAMDGNMDGMADVFSDTLIPGKQINGLMHGSRIRFESTADGFVISSKVVINRDIPIEKMALLELTGETLLFVAYQNGQLTRHHFPAGQWTISRSENAFVPLRPGEAVAAMSVCSDSRGDGITVILTGNGRIITCDFSGTAQEIVPESVLEDPSHDIALGDLDSDGAMEMVVTAHGQVFAFNLNGTLVNHYPIPRQPGPVVLSSPVLGDVDGDDEIEIILANSMGNVESYKKDGSMAEGFPLVIGGESPPNTPILSDLDGDGLIELAAVSEDGVVLVWDMSGKWDDQSAPWPEYLHDSGHTANVVRDLEEPFAGPDWMPDNLVYNYPNPNIENRTIIRYRLEKPASVNIRIYDMAGNLIQEMAGPGLGKTENEVVWNLSGVSSGLYFCRVTAVGDTGEKTVIFKIAVVK